MKRASAREAVAAIPDGATVVFPHGCVEPSSFYEAFVRDVDRFRSLRVYSGHCFGDYRFLQRGLGTNFRYFTWQASPRIRGLAREGKIGFVPMRFSEITRLVSRTGPIPPDVVVVQVSPRGPGGSANLGISVSLFRDLVASASLVIAEMTESMPPMHGESAIAPEELDLVIASDAPPGVYLPPAPTDRERRIADLVLDLIPDGAWVQVGIGSLPDLVLSRLGEKRGVRLYSGMLSQGLLRFLDEARHTPEIITGELAGDRDLYDACSRNPIVRLAPSSVTHDVTRIAALPRFVSVNSAVEVDLHGQVNGETIGNLQISGVGGSLDYVEGAALSEGGRSIIAITATTEDRTRSKIVPQLSGGVVTTPRFCTDYVVTEYGAVRLKGKDLAARAEALIEIADPEFRESLKCGLASRPS